MKTKTETAYWLVNSNLNQRGATDLAWEYGLTQLERTNKATVAKHAVEIAWLRFRWELVYCASISWQRNYRKAEPIETVTTYDGIV